MVAIAENVPLQKGTLLAKSSKRWAYALWLAVICGFAVLHALHLSADFPNNTPWFSDWAKYTDEGWYGNAAVRAHLFGNWYLPGDFNPASAVPVWPFLEWVVFGFTGVTIEAARGLAAAFFFVNLLLSYWFLRARGPRWMALLAVSLLVTSPFLYCFSRLAILEPMLTAFTLAALNLAIRLPCFRRPVAVSFGIGVIFTLMMLTKTTAVFLLPSLGWAIVVPLWQQRRVAIRCVVSAGAGFAATFGLWMVLLVHYGLMSDYKYLFYVNKYIKPKEFYWPLLSLWWSFHGGLWVDRLLIPLAGLVTVAAAMAWRTGWSRQLQRNPAFGASLLAVAGYILFMTYQNHPQPRYFAVVAFFSFFVLATGAQAMLGAAPWGARGIEENRRRGVAETNPAGGTKGRLAGRRNGAALAGSALVGGAVIAACLNGVATLNYAVHPEYTLVPAAQKLTRYIDQHPNGKRLLVSISGDEISMITHLPSICDDFGTQDLVSKLAAYQPGWYATWNDLDPGTLEDLHSHYSLEQMASFHAFDDPERNVLVLFKLHPLPEGQVRDPGIQNLQVPLSDDKIDIPVQ
jgi:Dolichyl-phosphate-mannose-protein mannosyltransferase